VICKDSGDETMLIDPYRRVMIPLNPAATKIWGLIDGARTVSAIVESVTDSFDVDGETAKRDVVDFLKELIRREMIR
jgi:hypothetical protein